MSHMKLVDEITKFELKYVKMQRKDAINKIRNSNRQTKTEKRIEKRIQIELQKKLDLGQY
jgi:hypothetical protein